MKRLILFGLYLLLPVFLRAQHPDCDQMLKDGDALMRRKDPPLDEALRAYLNALNCNSQLAGIVGPKIQYVFDEINKQKKREQQARQQATVALAKAERLIKFFTFNKENAAWAYNTDSRGFAVIDEDGKKLSGFNYENPEPFHNGLAVAQVNNQYVFVDEKGREVTDHYDYLVLMTKNRYLVGSTGKGELVLDSTGKEMFQFYGSSDGLIIIIKDDKKGLTDSTGQLIMIPQYDEIRPFSDGLAWVEKEGKWGVIDKKGVEIIPPQYQYIDSFSEGIAPAYNDIKKRWVFIDKSGAEVLLLQNEKGYLESTYVDVHPFSDNLAIVQNLENSGIIDKSGAEVVPPIYDFIGSFSEGLATVRSGQKWGLIDKNTLEVMWLPYDYELVGDFSEGLAWVKEGGKFGFIDKKGVEVVPPIYDDFWEIFEGLALVKKDEKWIFIDKNGLEVQEWQYDYVGAFSEGMARVEKKGKWGFIDESGAEVVKPQYEWVWAFSEGMARVEKEGKWGFIDKSGAIVIPLQYKEVGEFSEGWAPVKKEWVWGFIDKSGEEVIPPQYWKAWPFSGSRAVVQKERKWFFIDKNGVEIMQLPYQEVEPFSEGLAPVKQAGKCGFMDKSGAEIIPMQYQEVRPFSEGLALVRQAGKCGFIDKLGSEIIPILYQEALSFTEGLAKVRNAGMMWGLLDILGHEILPCTYSDIHPYGYRTYQLEQNNRYGLFAPDLGIRIEPAYEKIGRTGEENDWIRVQQNGKWGWVDKTGKIIIPCRYDAASPFRRGRAQVLQLPYEEFFYINTKGEMLLGR